MHLNVIDIIILALFIPAIWSGISKGLVRQVAGLAALILGVWGAYHFSDFAADKLKPLLDVDPSTLSLISFIVVFIIILVGVILVGRAAEGIIKITLLTWVDKLLGVFFSILKTAFILSLIFYLLNSINAIWDFLPKEKFADSEVYKIISRIAPAVFPYIRNL